MKKEIRIVLLVCCVAVAGIIGLQGAWIRNYYTVNQDRFEKEVNLAFEDAIKKEFQIRCDTLENLIYHYLMDTSKISITSRWSEKNKVWIYRVADKNILKDRQEFAHKLINLPILSDQDTVKRIVAHHYARTYREDDLEKHTIFYRTQEIGKYVSRKLEAYSFDTNRLRPVYTQLLAERGIHQPFVFYLRDEDSTVNRSRFPDSLQEQYPVITKSFPTYKLEPDNNFVRAMFTTSANYVAGKLTGIMIASGILIIIVAFAMYWLLRIIRREKKLAAIKNDFISNISHELKTPIATVTAAVDAMEGFGVLNNPDKTKRYLNISRNELQRLSDMVNKILNISLYERQDFELKPEPVNVDELVEELIVRYTVAGGKQITFEYVNETGIAVVKADKLHLYNVVNNLVDNAVKYSGEEVAINIRFRREKDHYVIMIKDNGIGISRADLPYIFDKFYRVPAGNIHKVKGYGLGLSYVKYIMEKHGGWCIAESHPGNGSTFKLGLQV
jgi:two-component system phosphate regulon sensor histidine kinase PhoR